MLAKREPKKVLLVVLTSDRGMCGFNANISRETERCIRASAGTTHEVMALAITSKKGQDYFGRRPQYTVFKNYRGVFENTGDEKAAEIGDEIVSAYESDGYDAVYLVVSEFKSAISQKVVQEKILPVEPETGEVNQAMLDFEYEPDKAAVLDQALPLYVNNQIYRAILESIASEMGARMTAMDSATRNASELMGKLAFSVQPRAAGGPEIVGGAEALEGSRGHGHVLRQNHGGLGSGRGRAVPGWRLPFIYTALRVTEDPQELRLGPPGRF